MDTRRKPVQVQGQHANSTRKGPGHTGDYVKQGYHTKQKRGIKC